MKGLVFGRRSDDVPTPSESSSGSSEAMPARHGRRWMRLHKFAWGGKAAPQASFDELEESASSRVEPLGAPRHASPGRAARAAAISAVNLAAYARALGAQLPQDRALLPLVIRLLTDPLPVGWTDGEDEAGERVYTHGRTRAPQREHPCEAEHRRHFCEAKYGAGTYLARCMARLRPSAEANELRAKGVDELGSLVEQFRRYDRSASGLVTLDDFVATARRVGTRDGSQFSVRQLRVLWETLDPSTAGSINLAQFAAGMGGERLTRHTPESVSARGSRSGSRHGSLRGSRDGKSSPRTPTARGDIPLIAKAAGSGAGAGAGVYFVDPRLLRATSARANASFADSRRSSLGFLEAGLAGERGPAAADVDGDASAAGARPAPRRSPRSSTPEGGGNSSRRTSLTSAQGASSRRGSASSITSVGSAAGSHNSAVWALAELRSLALRAGAAARAQTQPRERSPRTSSEQATNEVARIGKTLEPAARRALLAAVREGRARTAERVRQRGAADSHDGTYRRSLQDRIGELRARRPLTNSSDSSATPAPPPARSGVTQAGAPPSRERRSSLERDRDRARVREPAAPGSAAAHDRGPRAPRPSALEIVIEIPRQPPRLRRGSSSNSAAASRVRGARSSRSSVSSALGQAVAPLPVKALAVEVDGDDGQLEA
ncbi:hypothetical protein KFE25_002560 [Diacronema lutheri]|uniref:EF-hand domain-containing protein n=1 Tax=Diacronema lutheri TaxID=2081491 RepID=A0A8J5X4H1_DIALT|nr:hypothetical protein KFE25_002560 [Diacronema lutheri]